MVSKNALQRFIDLLIADQSAPAETSPAETGSVSGRKSAIVAISPPNLFPQAVWDELVK